LDLFDKNKVLKTGEKKVFRLDNEDDENTELFEYFLVNSFELISSYYSLAISANSKSQTSTANTASRILDANEAKKSLQVFKPIFGLKNNFVLKCFDFKKKILIEITKQLLKLRFVNKKYLKLLETNELVICCQRYFDIFFCLLKLELSRNISAEVEKELKAMIDLVLRPDDSNELNYFAGLDLVVKTVEQYFSDPQLYILIMTKLNEHLKANKSRYTDTQFEDSKASIDHLNAFETVYHLLSMPFKNFEKLNLEQVGHSI
jgi:hypothetical protein